MHMLMRYEVFLVVGRGRGKGAAVRVSLLKRCFGREGLGLSLSTWSNWA